MVQFPAARLPLAVGDTNESLGSTLAVTDFNQHKALVTCTQIGGSPVEVLQVFELYGPLEGRRAASLVEHGCVLHFP